ncbi:conserved exported hypothetical protein [Cupriavidus taiwanensis]|uniref:cupin domain-containing protein n=1 Tax=Cupriavidus taiwanensis TaxID=164546 RepID=UPI000E144A01|nr:cupin domain-containing protein [Cupriavidus taiwanensis]SOZ16124.1 conserved exported hypothetical protein [Cupriavidus taiwanensis]SOZ29234.1 conserved exported hypothetical protein [Cupriavidus taiwanensis]SOZ46700.1 conserved exported hypothetical protein [Cupriavidus taiwanensis]SPA00663.1 conserved exported hypothetical protein [Cupriavidus taiwanensis]
MKLAKLATAAMTVACLAATIHSAHAQAPGIHRADLVSHELSVAGKEGIQVRVDFEPGAFAPRHAHPGEEIAHVLQGSLEYQLGDQRPVTLKAGESLFIPAGTPHSARNVGSGLASELATYIVTKGSPLVVPAK